MTVRVWGFYTSRFERSSSFFSAAGVSLAVVMVLSLASAPALAGVYVEAAADPFVTWIGSVTSQGDAAMQADLARSTYSVDGSGIKIGVISDSYNANAGAAANVAAGDLPGVGNPNGYGTAVTVVKEHAGMSDEGRAMLQIIHDVAPGAQLYFHSAFNSPGAVGTPPSTTIANAIDALVSQGVDIIVDDVGILTQARFQDGAAAQSVDAAKAAGIAYFSSAGNADNNATRVTYAGGVGGTVNWGTNDGLEISFSGFGRLMVQWSDPYQTVSGAAAVTDFAVEITDTTGATTHLVINANNASDDPYEFVAIVGPAGPIGIRVRHLSGSTDDLVQVSTFDGFGITDVDDTNHQTINGHAAALGGVAVAAHLHSVPGSVESFSSRGPTDIFFDTAGNAVNVSRATPLLTAPDGVATSVGGFSPFFGTSAAAPHAAAVAALMLERADDLAFPMTVDELYQFLYDEAVDIETVGFDNLSGYGRIDAFAAVGAVPEPATLLVLAI
ncbi:hypothetical protein LCGC14_1805930, partial [marine sediment metagenome]